MTKVIVSGGCSFAYGFNLENRSERYSKVIAGAYGKDLIDVSIAGCSNEHIGSCMAIGINRALQNYDAKDIVAIVGWTDMMRYEAWNKFQNRIQSFYIDQESHRNGDFIDGDPVARTIAANAAFVARHVWTAEWSYYKLVHAFNYVSAVCRSHGIPVIHRASLPLARFPFAKGNVKFSENKNEWYTEQVVMPDDQDTFDKLFHSRTFHGLTREDPVKYQIENGFDSHPNSLGHAKWAECLMSVHGDVLGR